jgi:hypothetical protein
MLKRKRISGFNYRLYAVIRFSHLSSRRYGIAVSIMYVGSRYLGFLREGSDICCFVHLCIYASMHLFMELYEVPNILSLISSGIQ